ncbi:CHASE domain-containing protein [Pseudomonas sp. PCH446]
MASEADRAEAARAAARTGEARLTAPITLERALDKPEQAFLILLPIYKHGIVLPTESEREAAIVGWGFAPLQIENVLEGLVPQGEAVNLRLKDITVPGSPEQFYQTTYESGAQPAALMTIPWSGMSSVGAGRLKCRHCRCSSNACTWCRRCWCFSLVSWPACCWQRSPPLPGSVPSGVCR